MRPAKRTGATMSRGSALLNTLFILLVLLILLTGMLKLVVGHFSLAHADATFAAAIDTAEAGINDEIRSMNGGTAPASLGTPYTGTLGSGDWTGTYSVYCTQLDGTAIPNPAAPPSQVLVWSAGTVGNATRTVRARATQGTGAYNYGVFSKISGVINGSQNITGSVGTAGTVTVNGANGISDKVLGLHGTTSTATINPPGSFTTERRPAITFPTVSEIADQKFGSGGQTYLKTVNDNSLSSAYVTSGILNGSIYNNRSVTPAIANSAISANGTGTITFTGKPGGANYYLNNMTLNGTWAVNFNNDAGPINLWCIGKNNGSGTFVINGGQSSTTMAQDPSKAVRVYVSDKCNITLNGSGTGRYGVYAISNSTGGNVTLNGSNNLYGSVIANTYTFNGTNSINYTAGYFAIGVAKWQYSGEYVEMNPR